MIKSSFVVTVVVWNPAYDSAFFQSRLLSLSPKKENEFPQYRMPGTGSTAGIDASVSNDSSLSEENFQIAT